jgi:hypothetical protein
MMYLKYPHILPDARGKRIRVDIGKRRKPSERGGGLFKGCVEYILPDFLGAGI